MKLPLTIIDGEGNKKIIGEAEVESDSEGIHVTADIHDKAFAALLRGPSPTKHLSIGVADDGPQTIRHNVFEDKKGS